MEVQQLRLRLFDDLHPNELDDTLVKVEGGYLTNFVLETIITLAMANRADKQRFDVCLIASPAQIVSLCRDMLKGLPPVLQDDYDSTDYMRPEERTSRSDWRYYEALDPPPSIPEELLEGIDRYLRELVEWQDTFWWMMDDWSSSPYYLRKQKRLKRI